MNTSAGSASLTAALRLSMSLCTASGSRSETGPSQAGWFIIRPTASSPAMCSKTSGYSIISVTASGRPVPPKPFSRSLTYVE